MGRRRRRHCCQAVLGCRRPVTHIHFVLFVFRRHWWGAPNPLRRTGRRTPSVLSLSVWYQAGSYHADVHTFRWLIITTGPTALAIQAAIDTKSKTSGQKRKAEGAGADEKKSKGEWASLSRFRPVIEIAHRSPRNILLFVFPLFFVGFHCLPPLFVMALKKFKF